LIVIESDLESLVGRIVTHDVTFAICASIFR
jgi:hypothetical protein